jgi:hypothetical protein
MVEFRKMASRFLEYFDAELLEEDELFYELVIRREERAIKENINEQKRVLAFHIRAEIAEPFLFPTVTNFEPNREIQICEDKILNLSYIVKTNQIVGHANLLKGYKPKLFI